MIMVVYIIVKPKVVLQSVSKFCMTTLETPQIIFINISLFVALIFVWNFYSVQSFEYQFCFILGSIGRLICIYDIWVRLNIVLMSHLLDTHFPLLLLTIMRHLSSDSSSDNVESAVYVTVCWPIFVAVLVYSFSYFSAIFNVIGWDLHRPPTAAARCWSGFLSTLGPGWRNGWRGRWWWLT